MVKQQRVTLSFDEDENLPTFVAFGHNLKQKNTYTADIDIILNMPNYYIIQRKFLYEEKEVSIFLTHCEKEFVRGFLYYDNKEFAVLEHRTYSTLQIEDFCYDNISVIRLSENPFQK
jgi:hypothetical protein